MCGCMFVNVCWRVLVRVWVPVSGSVCGFVCGSVCVHVCVGTCLCEGERVCVGAYMSLLRV